MSELPPDVRDRAAQAAWERANSTDGPFGWADLAEDEQAAWKADADAVAEVLATTEHPFTAAQWERAYNRQGGEVIGYQDEIDRLQSRVEQLTAALTDALGGMEDMRPYVPAYFAEKWEHDAYIERARAALAAAVEEREQ